MNKKITDLKVEQVPCKKVGFREFKISYKYKGKPVVDYKIFDDEIYHDKLDHELYRLVAQDTNKRYVNGKLDRYARYYTGFTTKAICIGALLFIGGSTAGIAIPLAVNSSGGSAKNDFIVTVDAVEDVGYFEGGRTDVKRIYTNVKRGTTFGELTKDLNDPNCDVDPDDDGANLNGNFLYYVDQDGNQLKDDYEITKDITATARYKLVCFGLENISDNSVTLQFTKTSVEPVRYKPTIHFARYSNLKHWEEWNFYDDTSGLNDTITIGAGETVYFKGNNLTTASRSTYWDLTLVNPSEDDKVLAHGNIMSLVDNGLCNTTTIPANHTFAYLFANFAQLDLTDDFTMPATTLKDGCYDHMFENCSSLTYAPNLPASSLPYSCYASMFIGCTSLVNPPEFSAEVNINITGNTVFENMFNGCSKLDHMPDLSKVVIPTEDLTASVFAKMFMNCGSLTNVPKEKMFSCSSDRASLMCDHMFSGCTNILSADISNITAFSSQCFADMFSGCSNLNSLKVAFGTPESAEWPKVAGQEFTINWLDGVSETGQFFWYGTTPTIRGINTVPEGWSVNP